MMKLYGSPVCTSCKQALMLLSQYPIEWQYIDVSQIQGYQGDIPLLELEDGQQLVGLPAIAQYVRSMGFR